MPKRTLKDVCEIHGITRNVLDSLRTQGVNPWDDVAMAEAVRNRRGKSDSKSPAGPVGEVESSVGGEVLSLEDLERELASAPSPQIAQMRKIQISGLREAIKVRVERSELIPIDEVRERDTRIANAVRSAVIKLENDLPPKGVGLDEVGMQKAFRPILRAILEMLADDQSEFWKGK